MMARPQTQPRPSERDRHRYLYLSGWVRALELKLLDRAQTNRLFEARTQEDIDRVLSEADYPAGQSPDQRLQGESRAILDWLKTHLPNPLYVDALLAFHDAHNLKVVLKHLLSRWITSAPQPADVDAVAEAAGPAWPDFTDLASLPSFSDLAGQLLLPAGVEPALLYRQVAEHQAADLPAWLHEATTQALQRYLTRYALSDVDLYLDQVAWQRAQAKARETGNAFFCDYLALQADLINLDLLNRVRKQRMGRDILAKALVPGGSFDQDRWMGLYDLDEEALLAFLAPTAYVSLSPFFRQDAQAEDADRMGLVADNLLMRHLQTVRYVLEGPEVPLAFVLARQLEIKNVRLIITYLRNGLPAARARERLRDRYQPWR